SVKKEVQNSSTFIVWTRFRDLFKEESANILMMLIVTIGIFKITFEYSPARKLEDTNSLRQPLKLL
ncbi:hypothetical protein ABE42_04665, partial [Bacillus thuringiensis]|nr:hypothetical protein [Bacillus thuringiensis]